MNTTTLLWKETKPLPEEGKRKHLDAMEEVELRLLGDKFLKAGRIKRLPVGRLELPTKRKEVEPSSADIYLVSHRTGVALLEIQMDLPEQAFNPDLWIPWLRPGSADGIVNQLQKRLGLPLEESSYFCFISIYTPTKSTEAFVESHNADIVRLIYLDISPLPFNDDFVVSELNRDFCLRKGEASFMSYVAALHITARDKVGSADELSYGIKAKCSLPFFVTIELLLLERQTLATYYDMLVETTFSSISTLIGLKEKILNGLEEYYGVITRVNQFSAPLIDYGERTFGINNIYDSVIDRLDAVTFDITTRYQSNTSVLTFWLTVLFGALETGFLVSSVASLFYTANPFAVIVWATVAIVVTAGILSLILYNRIT